MSVSQPSSLYAVPGAQCRWLQLHCTYVWDCQKAEPAEDLEVSVESSKLSCEMQSTQAKEDMVWLRHVQGSRILRMIFTRPVTLKADSSFF